MRVRAVARRIDRRLRIRRKLPRDVIRNAMEDVFETDINIDAINKVIVIDSHKFLYNRVKKNANSYLSVVLNFISTKHVTRVVQSRRMAPKLRLLSEEEIGSLRDHRRMIVVRNPYSRTLSAFLDKFRVEDIRRAHGEFSLEPEGFRQFVRWLDDGGLSANGHWDLQAKEILMPLNRYTDVVRFEQLDETLPQFFADVGIDISGMNRKGAFDRGRRHETNASERLRRYYDDESRDTVARLFESDFKALGYAPDQLL